MIIHNKRNFLALLPFGVSTSNRFQHQVEDSPSLTYSGEPNTDRKSPGLNGANSPEISRNTSSVSLSAVAFCDSCLSSRRELELFKSRIGQLQFKLSTLEANHERTKKEHEDVSFLYFFNLIFRLLICYENELLN